ncbi:MAG TPA: GNAT family N-acetyltransferase [Burkholderiaceae bacterium]
MNDDRPIDIRPARPDDALCLGVLALQVFLDTYAPEGIHPPLAREALATGSVEGFAALVADQAISILVAERGGSLVGFAQVEHGKPHAQVAESRAAELRRLYVQEPFTGRGVGRALLARAEREAAARGARTLWLTAWTGNARALAVYPRCGYAHAGDTVYTIEGRDFPNKLFAKALAA